MVSIVRQLLVIAVLAAAGYGLWTARDAPWLEAIGLGGGDGTSTEIAGSAAEGVPVAVAPVRMQADDAVVESVGTGLALRSVTVYPSVAGEVVAVGFEAGDRVEKGQTLVRLDDRAETLAVDMAQVALKDARQTLERFERAVKSGAVPQSEVDAARTSLERARIDLQQAEVALDDRTVTAPFGGVVGLGRIEPGDRVTPETALTTLDDRSAVLVDFEVPESAVDHVAIGDSVRARTWSRPDARYEGRVVAMESRLDPESRTLQVRARLPNPDETLRPGMSFAIYIDLPGRTYPSVPETAVQWGRDGAYVWRVADGKAERVVVRIRERVDGRVLIAADLAEGEEIVVEGVQRLRAGMALDITERAADGADGEPVPAGES